MKIKTVVFDLDDTLLETGVLFCEILDDFCELIQSELSISGGKDDILACQEKVDIELLQSQGVTPERFSESLTRTYGMFAEREGREKKADVEKRLWTLGLRAFYGIPELCSDTLSVLQTLASRELFLYTWGSERTQRPKIEAHGLDKIFSEVHIVKEKSAEVLKGILGSRDPKETLVCGDSLRGEIGPALELGCHGVYIEKENAWAFHKIEVKGEYHRIPGIGGLPKIIADIEKTKEKF